jgi:hypothetical protein
MTRTHMASFLSELEKIAGLPGILGWAHPALAGRFGRQMAVGAGVGGLIGASKQPPAEQGGNWLQGAAKGALIGAGVTGAGHLLTQAGRDAARKSVSNFGTRLRYQMTGKGLKGVPGKPGDVAHAQEVGLLPEKPSVHDMQAHEQGWNTVPGMLRGMRHSPGKVIGNAWNRMDTTGKVVTGLSAADVGYQALRPSEPGEPGRAERTLSSGLGGLGFMVAPAGVIPSMLVGSTAGAIGGRLGRVVDRTAGGVQQPAPQIPESQYFAQGAAGG